MRLKGKRIAYLVGPGFEDLEFWVPLMRLQEEGALITAVGLNAGEEYIGKQSLQACSDVGCDEVTAEEFDAVVIPGGWAPDRLRRYDGIKRLVREAYRSGKVIGMICHAGLVGISAGIVKGHEATGSNGIRDDLVNAGAIWRDVPALRSKNLVWGRVVTDLPDFCRELVNALSEEA